VPPHSTPVVRPALQVRDVVLAVQPVVFLSDAQQLVPTVLSQFTTSLSASELSERVEWLWLMRRDVATYLRDNALRGHLLQQSPEQILAGSTSGGVRRLRGIFTLLRTPLTVFNLKTAPFQSNNALNSTCSNQTTTNVGNNAERRSSSTNQRCTSLDVVKVSAGPAVDTRWVPSR